MDFIKKISKIFAQIILLIFIGLLGNFVAHITHLPIPGSLIGMFILLGLLLSGVIKLEWIEVGAAILIGDLLLFFIPSATGIIQYTNLFGRTGATLIAVVFVSILLVIASVVVSTRWITILQRKGMKI